jgi:alpha-2-macroglobulin-like protein
MKIYGNNYQIHFGEMKQENLSSRFKRRMQRREKIVKGVFEVEQRFQTHISTDKPLYKLGDTVYVRGILLSPHKQQPISSTLLQNSQFYLGASFQILGPVSQLIYLFFQKGDVIVNNEILVWNHSVLSAQWEIPETQTGGEYVAKFLYKGNGLPSSERKFEIRAFQNPRLNSQIQFVRKG